MQINKAKLLEALEIVHPGLARNEQITQTTSFAFMKGRVVTYNDEISISHPVEGLEFEGAIEAENLYKFLGKIKKDEIDLTIKGNELILTSGRAKAGLTLQSEIKLPLEEVSEKKKWKDIPENMIKFIGFAMTSCAKLMSHPVLTCVHVTKEGMIESSDNYRITRCTLEGEEPVGDFLLPASSAVHVVKLQPVKIAEGKGWIHFQTEQGTVISCRVFEDNFPKLDSMLNIKGERITFPANLAEVLDRARVFSKRDNILDESITITLSEKRLKIRAEADTGWFEENVNFNYKGEPITITITPYLLKEILSETLDCTLGTRMLKFEGTGWVYATALRG